MVKIHSRLKRRLQLSTGLSHHNFFHPSVAKNRPKTFKTEESAKLWASTRSLKEGQYSLKNVKHGKRFQVVINNGKDKNSIN